MKKKFYTIVLLLIVSGCTTIQRLTEKYNLPGQILTFRTTGKVSEQNFEMFEGYEIKKQKTLVYRTPENKDQADVLLYIFENNEKALGAYLETRKERYAGKKLQNIGSDTVRWGHFSPEKNMAAFWHAEAVVLVIFKNTKNADEATEFCKKLTARWPKSPPRNPEFNLLLREETSLKEVWYAVNEKHLPENYLTSFFYAPWKSGAKNGHIVFRKFPDSISAENFLYSLSGNEGYYLTVIDYPARKLSYQVSVTSTGLFYKAGETIIGIRGNFTFPEARDELKKIWDVKD